KAGNREFDHARTTIEASIERMDVPEANLFLSEFLPSYEKTLDEISR
ncbi:MAG: 5'-deoxynucleotidase, partial [Lachnospiraceae bacterium]|nr:5'-deoxynucleotidase [Lachnospiraceae bacterium]